MSNNLSGAAALDAVCLAEAGSREALNRIKDSSGCAWNSLLAAASGNSVSGVVGKLSGRYESRF